MIENKPKPCKGIGKAIGVSGCGEKSIQRKFGLCPSCLSDFLFGTDAGKMIFHKQTLPKAKSRIETNVKREKSEQKKKDKEVKKKLEGLPPLRKQLEKWCNKICCLIDNGSGCISCNGKTTPQAGHYHTVKSNGSIRYNLHNLHLQDYNCNCAKGANIPAYDEGLLQRYGRRYWEYVKFDIVRLYPLIRMKEYEYIEKIETARKIANRLEKSGLTFTPAQRILLREKYNREIGIYTIPYDRESKSALDNEFSHE